MSMLSASSIAVKCNFTSDVLCGPALSCVALVPLDTLIST